MKIVYENEMSRLRDCALVRSDLLANFICKFFDIKIGTEKISDS